jgi:5'-nucleotidase
MADRDIPPERGVYCNRTLNLRAVKAIGYDMDYTLLHYRVEEWERVAFEHAVDHLATLGWDLGALEFDPDAFSLGLVFDLGLGNLIKATRFGYVVKAQHGSSTLDYDALRAAYRETVVDLAEDRFEFMNTLFELSRAALWTQLVERHDKRPLAGVHSYGDLYRIIADALDEVHQAGILKAQIVADPDRFVDPDPGITGTLLDQRKTGKQLMLITNSDWSYTRQMMSYAFDRHCPPSTTWRDLFDLVIVSAGKPRFFAGRDSIFRVVDEDRSLLEPHSGPLEAGHVYFGGNARLVERALGDSVGQPLYVGDHLFGDVHVTKDILRWRTALIVRELEPEIVGAMEFESSQKRLQDLMAQKIDVDRRQAQLRMERARGTADGSTIAELDKVTADAQALDADIAPLARSAADLGNQIWGPLMRAGNDKSLFARQVEKYADIYTSRVSNLGLETPFAYIRAARGSLPHEAAI